MMMPNDLLVYEIVGLRQLVETGVLRPLGGLRYQFTRDYLHNPTFPHPTKPHLDPLRAGNEWKAAQGGIIHLLDMSSTDRCVQTMDQQSHKFKFEFHGSAYRAYYGDVQYAGGEGPPSPNYGAAFPIVSIVQGKNTWQAGEFVSIQGHAYDTDSLMLSYSWQQVSGPVISISDSQSAKITFVAPYVTTQSEIVLQLTVSDGRNETVVETTVIVQ